MEEYEFKCEKCNFKCNKRGDYNRHLKTKKHNSINNEGIKKYKCDKCDKTYMSRTGLWRHKKTCDPSNQNDYKNMYLKLLKDHNKLKKEIDSKYHEIKQKQIKNEDRINELIKNMHNTQFNNATISQI